MVDATGLDVYSTNCLCPKQLPTQAEAKIDLTLHPTVLTSPLDTITPIS